ncbi:MAG: hypothetical protein Q7S17_06550 [Xanthobacteraceae bacterium]|nr:hypothetical protein [Xanthobacteraceae bacterium]
MTKERAAVSLPFAVLRCIAFLGEDGVVDATGAARRTVRCWSDPDDERRRLPAHQGIALDTACHLAGHGAPVLEAYDIILQRRVSAARGVAPHDAMPPKERLLAILTEFADVIRTLDRAMKDGGLDAAGRRAIVRDAYRMRDMLDQFVADVEHGSAIKLVFPPRQRPA